MTEARNFWSRRKAKVKAEEEAELVALEAETHAGEMAVQEEKSDEELLVELNLPDPDTMIEGDDFTAFMSKAVPDRLRRRALRKLWLTNPVLANIDGLVDYGEDYTDAAMVIENMQTAYQVGKGMTQHVLEMARQAEEAEQAEAADEGEDGEPEVLAIDERAESAPPETDDELAPESEETLVATIESAEIEIETDVTPPRRRMRFAYAE